MRSKNIRYSTIWNISFPIFLSLLAQNMIVVVDTVFLGRLGDVALGAGAIGGLMYICLYITGFGFGTGTQIIIGRRSGEKRFGEIGTFVDHSIYFLGIMAIGLIALMKIFLEPVLGIIISSPNITPLAGEFLDIRIWGLLFSYTNICFRAFYIGIGRTSYLIWSAVIMAAINIVMDYLLIFGNYGFPEMGIAGAALASVFAEALSALFFVMVTVRRTNNRIYRLFRFKKPEFTVIMILLRISLFIMIQYLASVLAWFLFFVVIERTGERPLAVSNIIRSIFMIFSIPVWALGATVNTLVSNTIGENNLQDVLPLVKRVTTICFLTMLVITAFVYGFHTPLLSFYSNDTDLIADAVQTLFVVMGAFLLFSVAIIGFNAVSGTANTIVSLTIEVVSIVFYLSAAWFLSVAPESRVYHIWLAEYVYAAFLGMLSFLYLYSGKWMHKNI